MENLNRVLLENVLPAHVAEHFLARNLKNEVSHLYISSALYEGSMLWIYHSMLSQTVGPYSQSIIYSYFHSPLPSRKAYVIALNAP